MTDEESDLGILFSLLDLQKMLVKALKNSVGLDKEEIKSSHTPVFE